MEKIFFILVCTFYSYCCSAQLNSSFDYTRTGWLLHKIDDSAVVYKRPDLRDYEERNSFNLAYSILYKYLPPSRDLSTSTPDNTDISYELILISPNNQQVLLIGDHWISDEHSWTPITEADYRQLKMWFEGRVKVEGLENIKKQKIKNLALHFQTEFEPDFLPWDEYIRAGKGESDNANTTSTSANTKIQSRTFASEISPRSPAPNTLIAQLNVDKANQINTGSHLNNPSGGTSSMPWKLYIGIFIFTGLIALISVWRRKR